MARNRKPPNKTETIKERAAALICISPVLAVSNARTGYMLIAIGYHRVLKKLEIAFFINRNFSYKLNSLTQPSPKERGLG
jgi:hypothetical protein